MTGFDPVSGLATVVVSGGFLIGTFGSGSEPTDECIAATTDGH